MVFTPTGILKGVACPAGDTCKVANCIFSHDRTVQPSAIEQSTSESRHAVDETEASPLTPPAKRRKLTYDNAADKPPSRADKIRAEIANARSAATYESNATQVGAENRKGNIHIDLEHVPPSMTKPVSPPPKTGTATPRPASNRINDGRSDSSNKDGQRSPVKPAPTLNETLNPRKLAHDPAGHNARTLFLKHLHGEIVRLNRLVSEAEDLAHKAGLQLSDQESIKLALDEEEKAARDQPKVYGNVIRARIAFYKKMKLPDWLEHVRTTLSRTDTDQDVKPNSSSLSTGLSPEQEALILPHLVADQSKLVKFGYIPEPPSEAAIAEASAAALAAENFETCERCTASFQVFPDRNEEGKLTSRGPCKHHPNRLTYPTRSKGDVASGLPKEPFYPCCNEERGKPGCTEKDDHVFKASTPARLAAVLPFMTTPENKSPATDKKGNKIMAVAFDCEMGHTVFGMELIRLTAISWPGGEGLLDVLVRPLGAVIDLNSRFSGVWPEHFAQAVPYERFTASPDDALGNATSQTALAIVESPHKARELLCSFLTPRTPLIGHAIDNDLNAVRLCHPTVVDTVELYPHPKGLPFRLGLKNLTVKHLQRQIQMGGDQGHDSLEDARATGDLVRVEVGRKWRVLYSQGWRIEKDRLVPPPSLQHRSSNGDSGSVDLLVAEAFDHGDRTAGKKRRKNRPGDGAAGENTEDEEVPLGNGIGMYAEKARRESQVQTKSR